MNYNTKNEMAYAIGIRSIVICHREYTISCCNVYNDFSDRFCVCSVITKINWNHLGHLYVTNNDILGEEKIPEMCVIWHGFRLIWVVIMFCYYFLFLLSLLFSWRQEKSYLLSRKMDRNLAWHISPFTTSHS